MNKWVANVYSQVYYRVLENSLSDIKNRIPIIAFLGKLFLNINFITLNKRP